MSLYSPQSRQKTGPHVFRWKGGTSKHSVEEGKKGAAHQRRSKYVKQSLAVNIQWGVKCGAMLVHPKRSSSGWLANMALPLGVPGPTNGEMTGGYEQRQGRAHWRERRKFKDKIYGVNNGLERKGWLMALQLNCYMLHPISSKRNKMHVNNQMFLS